MNVVDVKPAAPGFAQRLTARLTGGSATSRHRDVQGSATRAAVLGAGDGLITNVSLVLGVAGASAGVSTVRLAGVAGLLAGAFSMAAGELVSVRAQYELVAREIAVERAELTDEPEAEEHELAMMYQARGVPPADAATVARILSANHEIALDTHTRLELGIDPDAGGSAGRASAASFVSFGVGALLPLFFLASAPAILLSIVIGAVAAFTLGAVTGAFTGRGVVRTGGRQLAVAAIAAAVTFGVGSLLGVQTG
jgi:VIT1/CCC1 family predicted Fe2+/Mn2+ transporter